jgi:hypothetical protein
MALAGTLGTEDDRQRRRRVEILDCRAGLRGAGGNVSNDTVGRQSELFKKIEASKGRIRRTRARVAARNAAGQDAGDDERWLAIELDFLRTLEDLLKELKE